MAVTKRISEVTIGGTAIDNPTNYNWNDYSNYPNLDLSKQYQRLNVMAFDGSSVVPLQVTGLVQVNGQGQPMLSVNDPVYLPCPPFCP